MNSNGNVQLSDAGGPSSITNAFGRVMATDIRGDLTVRNTNGAVEARTILGAADLSTSFASITFFDQIVIRVRITLSCRNNEIMISIF